MMYCIVIDFASQLILLYCMWGTVISCSCCCGNCLSGLNCYPWPMTTWDWVARGQAFTAEEFVVPVWVEREGGGERGRNSEGGMEWERERWPVKCFPYVPEGWERLITLWWLSDIAVAVCVCVPACERVFCTSPYLSSLWNPHTEHTGVTLENPELSPLRPTANPLKPVFLLHTKTCSSHKTHPKCYGRQIDKSWSKQHSYPLKNNCSLKYAFVWL